MPHKPKFREEFIDELLKSWREGWHKDVRAHLRSSTPAQAAYIAASICSLLGAEMGMAEFVAFIHPDN